MKIGRSNIRSLQTANNNGMARRVDNRIDVTVDAYAARFKNALAVDGTVAFIFNKHAGIIPCTCRGFRDLSGINTHEVGISGHETDRGDTSRNYESKHAHIQVAKDTRIKQVGGLRPSDLDDVFRSRNETIVDKIKNEASEEDDTAGYVKDSADDIMDAVFNGAPAPIFSGNGDPMQRILASTSLNNSDNLSYSQNFVACPICFGSGCVDTWRLYNGERIILDASEAHDLDVYGDINVKEDSQPASYQLYMNSYVKWSNVKFPTSWRHLMRLAVFNGSQELPLDSYRMYYIHPSQPQMRNPLTYATLSLLSNGALLNQSNGLTIILESTQTNNDDEPFTFTHVEFMLSLGQPVRVQIPDMDVPNEDEYVDWNLSVSLELPSDIEIKENSYIVEGKYTRTWKVTQVNRKLTARGKSFGYSVSVRALHSFERLFFLMNILGKPRNPFSNKDLENMQDGDY